MMPRVLHIITGLHTGGAETMLYKLLTRPTGFEPAVLALIAGGEMAARITALGVPVHLLDMPRGRPTPVGLWRLRRVVRRFRPHLIQGWMYHGNLAGSLAAHLVGKPPLVWNIRTSLDGWQPGRGHIARIGAQFAGTAARIIFNSATSARLHAQIGYPSARSVIIPNGFDGDVFNPQPAARAAVRDELGILPDAPLLGMVGRYLPAKDHATFLQAAALLPADIHFLLAGRDVSPQNGVLWGQVRALGLVGRVHLLGERADVPRLMAALDVLALPSWYEGFPNVVGEAMACGVPCVVSDVSDHAEIVGETGAIVPPQDAAGLAAACQQLLRRPDRAALGLQARARILERYSLDAICQQYAALYQEMLG